MRTHLRTLSALTLGALAAACSESGDSGGAEGGGGSASGPSSGPHMSSGPGGPGGSSGSTGTPDGSPGCGKGSAGDEVITVDVAGESRTYLRSVPTSYSNKTPQALYFVFHGYGGNHDAVTGLGIQNDAIGIFPDGIPRGDAPSGWDEGPESTDVALFDTIMETTLAEYCVDKKRVYAAGFSWGGWMATALGCLRGDVVRAFASVEGGVLNNPADCKGPVAGWVNHYTADGAEPFTSGQHTVDFFAELNAASNPTAFDAPNPCVKYAGTAPLVFCTPEGENHDWPGYATASIKSFFSGL